MNKSTALILTKIESMTSKEIADLTGKKHHHVIRDIKGIVCELLDYPNLDNIDFKQVSIDGIKFEFDDRGFISVVKLDKTHTILLTTGYSVKQRKLVIDRWQFLEDQLEILKSAKDTKKRQLEAMEALSHLLPDDLSGEALSYIKANTVVNKAVSNLFGFPKMLKKDQMSADMIEIRDKVLDDYIKLYEVIEDNSKVRDVLYEKYQPKRLEVN